MGREIDIALPQPEHLDPSQAVERLQRDEHPLQPPGRSIQANELVAVQPSTVAWGSRGDRPRSDLGGERIVRPSGEATERREVQRERGRGPGERGP